MNKKLLITRWLAVALCLVVSLTASAYDFMEGFLAYNYNADGTSVTVTYRTKSTYTNGMYTPTYSNASGSLVIPSSVYHNGRNYAVTAIGEEAFKGCSGFTSSLAIPNSVTSIGDYAFYGCSGFTGSLTIPNSVTTIGEAAFYYCSGFTGSLTIPNSVTEIGSSAFYVCSGFTGSLTIPNSVTSIGDYAFYCCCGFTSIVVTSGNPKYDSRGNCNAIIETSTNTLILGCKSTIVPSTVKIIGVGAFVSVSLESINLPEGVECIERYAFEDCYELCSVYLPSSLKELKVGAFGYSSLNGLISICRKTYVPDLNAYCKINVEYDPGNCASPSPGGDLYVGGEHILDLVIPNGVTTLQAHFGRYNIQSVRIPNSVKTLGYGAFYLCENLKTVYIPESVNQIKSYCFYDCKNLQNIYCEITNPQGVATDYTFGDGGVYDDFPYSNCVLHVPAGTKTLYQQTSPWNKFVNIVDDIVVKGDVNGDGRVDINDVNAVVNLILGRSTLYRDRADITGDGKVSVSDLNAVVNVMLGRTVN